MKKELTEYTLGEPSKEVIQVFKSGKQVGFGIMGIVSCLEKIFVDEESTKKDWYIAEGNKVFKVDREEYRLTLVEMLKNMEIDFNETDDIEKLQTLAGRYNGK
jgi:hypothetical protein